LGYSEQFGKHVTDISFFISNTMFDAQRRPFILPSKPKLIFLVDKMTYSEYIITNSYKNTMD